MRILVNYDKNEQNYLPILQYHLKQRHFEAIATNSILNIGELLAKAQMAKCDAILICNEGTLKYCVPGEKPTLDSYRGSRLNFSIPAIVCNSLAHTHTIDEGTFLLQTDLDKFLPTKLKRQAERFSFTVVDTQEEQDKAFKILSESVLIAYDIETKTVNEIDDDKEDIHEAGDTYITCCSWACLTKQGTIKVFVLPLVDFFENHYVTDFEYAQAIAFLRKVNSLPIHKVMHNGMYDCLHSIVYHAEPHNWVLDTMALSWCQYSSLPKDLSFVASITLPDYCQWKGESGDASKNNDINAYWGYNGKDTWYTLRIILEQLKTAPAYAKKNYQLCFRTVYPFLYTAFEGIKIDNAKRKALKQERQLQLDKALAELRVMLHDERFNPGSWQQVAAYIYDIFGAADPKIGKKKNGEGKKVTITRGTDEKNLKAVGEQHPILFRVTEAILSYREAQKAIGTYFNFTQKNGRLLYSLDPFGTETGRSACRSSSFWCGTQVQNIPPYAKGMLVADEGNEIVEHDNSKSEAVCTAYLSQDTALIEVLNDKHKDFYKSLGTLLFAIPYVDVTKEFRNLVLKKVVHGSNYMMGAATFIENAGAENILKGARVLGKLVTIQLKPPAGYVTIKAFATELLESYHAPFPRIRKWYVEVKNEIASTNMLVSPLGFTRYFFGDILKKYQIFASAVAHGPQNLSVMEINKGVWNVWQLCKKSKGELRLKAQVHDSILTQIPKTKPEYRLKIKEAMNNPIVVHGRTMVIPVEYKYGDNWADMTEVKD